MANNYQTDWVQVMQKYPQSYPEADDIFIVSVEEKKWTVNIIEYPKIISIFNQQTQQLTTTAGRLMTIVDQLVTPIKKKEKDQTIANDDWSEEFENESCDWSFGSADGDLVDQPDEFDDHYLTDGLINGEESVDWTQHPHLTTDLQIIRQWLGQEAVSVVTDPPNGQYSTLLQIPVLSLISRMTAEAWKVDPDQPIVVEFTFESTVYLQSPFPPKVAIYQDNHRKSFGLRFQLENISRELFQVIWPLIQPGQLYELNHHLVPADRLTAKPILKITPKTLTVSQPTSYSEGTGKTNCSVEDQAEHCFVRDQGDGRNLTISPIPDQDLAVLLDMDFTEKEIKIAWQGDFNETLDCLLYPKGLAGAAFQTGDKQTPSTNTQTPSTNTQTPSTNTQTPPANIWKGLKHWCSDSGKPFTSNSTEHQTKTKKRSTRMVMNLTAAVRKESSNQPVPSEWQGLDPKRQVLLDNLLEKGLIITDHGFFYLVIAYLASRIRQLNNFCAICDHPHVLGMTGMLKPTICARSLCCFSYQQLGVAADSVEYISSSAEVVELLILLAKIAARSDRAEQILIPFPLLVDPLRADRLVLDPNNKDLALVRTIVQSLPSMEVIVQISDQKGDLSLAAALEQHGSHPQAFQMLQWLITSNRSHILKLNPEQQITELKTNHQFLMLSQSPEKETRFAELKQTHGAVFGFHGSPMDNWHAILRSGLKNASGTKLQLHGAAHGSGIYISPNSTVSMSYCGYSSTTGEGKTGGQDKRFLNTDQLRCLAICEIIDHQIHGRNSDIWVIPNEDYVCTRFLMVYSGQQQIDNCHLNKMTDRLRQAIAAYQL